MLQHIVGCIRAGVTGMAGSARARAHPSRYSARETASGAGCSSMAACIAAPSDTVESSNTAMVLCGNAPGPRAVAARGMMQSASSSSHPSEVMHS